MHLPFVAQRKQSSSSRISTTFDELNQALSAAAADPKKKVVHNLRTNTRRLETLIQYRLPPGSEKKLEGELKNLRQAAGAVRDVDVQNMLVDSFESPQSTRGRAFVRAKLDLMRARSEKKLIQLLSPQAVQQLERWLSQCRRKLAKATHANSDHQDDLATALQQYSGLLCHFEPLRRNNIHEFRKSCKHLRYLAELAPDSAEKKAAVEAFKQIQDSIGDWHDVLTLIDVTKAALTAPKQSVFLKELQDLEEKKFQESLETCQNAKRELIRLEAEQLTAQRKRPRSASSSRTTQSRASG